MQICLIIKKNPCFLRTLFSAKNLNALIYLSFEPHFSYFGKILLNLYKYTYIMGHHIHGQHLYADGSVFQDECKIYTTILK